MHCTHSARATPIDFQSSPHANTCASPPPNQYGPPQQGYGPPPGGQYYPPQQQMGYQQPPPQQPPPKQKKDRGCLMSCLAVMCCCFLCEEGCECCAECCEVSIHPTIFYLVRGGLLLTSSSARKTAAREHELQGKLEKYHNASSFACSTRIMLGTENGNGYEWEPLPWERQRLQGERWPTFMSFGWMSILGCCCFIACVFTCCMLSCCRVTSYSSLSISNVHCFHGLLALGSSCTAIPFFATL